MNVSKIVGTVLIVFLHIPLIVSIWTGKKKQPFSTWALLCSLNTLTLFSVLKTHGNWQPIAIYVIANAIIATSVLLQGQFYWGSLEYYCCGLIMFCICVWIISGPQIATIASSLSIVIASFPQLRDSWNDPRSNPWLVWIGFTFANAISTAGGIEWSIEERFYGTTCTVLCAFRAGTSLIHK